MLGAAIAGGTGFRTSKTQATTTPYPSVMFQSVKNPIRR